MLSIPLNDTVPNGSNFLTVEGKQEFREKRQTRTSFNLDDLPVFVIPKDQNEQSEGLRPRVYSLYERQDLEWSRFFSIFDRKKCF